MVAESKPINNAWKVLLLVFAVALGFRLISITWGLPNQTHLFSYHPDEFPIWAFSQALDPAKGKFTPGFYNYGTLYLLVVRIMTDLVSAYGGAPKGGPESQLLFVGSVQLACRVFNAFCGAGLAAVTAATVRRYLGDLWGAAAGLAMALSPTLIIHSRFATVDVPAAFLLGLSTYFALKLIPADGEAEATPQQLMKWAALCGLYAGLSAGVKYTGILALVMLLVVAIRDSRPGAWQRFGAGCLVALVAFVVSTPGVILEREKFLTDFKYEMLHVSTGHGLEFMSTLPGPIYHFINLNMCLGILAVLGLIGLAAKIKVPWLLPVAVFAVIYVLLISRGEVKFLRYTFPLLMPLVLGASALIREPVERAKTDAVGKGLMAFLLVATICSGSGSAFFGVLDEDPRDQAAAYLKEVGKGKTVGLTKDPWFYTTPLFPWTGMQRGSFSALFRHMQEAQDPKVVQFLPPRIQERFDFDVRLPEVIKPDYIVLSSIETEDAKRILEKGTDDPIGKLTAARYKEFMASLESKYTIEKSFGSTPVFPVPDINYVCLKVDIWRRNGTP